MQEIFANRITKTLTLPDTGHTVTIRKLNGGQLAAVRSAAQRRALAEVEALGGMKKIAELQQFGPGAADESEKAARRDPFLTHDTMTLLERGVLHWTLDEEPGPAAYEELDTEIAEWLAREILRLTKPALFEDADAAA
jgi:hypothetical protein